MGTNYYWYEKRDCKNDNPVHIGKSSCGWCFSLHVDPEQGVNDLPDWIEKFKAEGSYIQDEYGTEISVEEMLVCIQERSFDRKPDHWKPVQVFGYTMQSDYTSEEDFLNKNHAVLGPNGLLRHRLENNWCIKQGDGTWDCLVGEFS